MINQLFFLLYALLLVFLRNKNRMKKQVVSLFHNTFSLLDREVLSVGELEKNLLHTSKDRRRFHDKIQDKLPLMTKNHSDFKIISPFYDRSKVCKASNCHCPFHKRMRQEAIKKYQIRTRKVFNSTIQSPTKTRESHEQDDHPRLSHKLFSKNKQNHNTESHEHQAKFSNRNKINSYNIQFDEFLKQANLMLLSKQIFGKINDHTVKSSVGEIFQYLYNHLDQSREQIADYIQKIEKDRDLTNFYLERFDDLKRRRTQKPRNTKSKPTSKDLHHENQSRNVLKSNTRQIQRKTTILPRKQKSQKTLPMQKLIKIVKDGIQIEDDEINQVANLDIQSFFENCSHLKKKIATFDFETLENIKEQIIEKLERNINNNKKQADYLRKKSIVSDLLKIADKTLAQLEEQNDNEYEKQQYDRISSSYSKLSESRKGSCEFQGRKRSSKFNDIAKKTLLLQQNNQNQRAKETDDQDDPSSNRQNSSGANNSSRISHNTKINTAFVSRDEIPESLKKSQAKFKLAKYRRLSHDGFFMKHNNSGDQFSLFIPKMNVENVQDIGYGLDTMALQFGDKWKKIKEIQRRISDMKMKKYIIFEEDSLITAKRKIRMLKDLLKKQVFQGAVKEQIKQYVTLIEQFNLLKNRNWAEKKLRNMMNLKNDDIQIMEGNQQSIEDFIKKHILDIFGRKNKLMYYDVSVTEYQEKEISLQNHLFQIIEKDLKLQKAKSIKRLEKKYTKTLSQNIHQQQQSKNREDELMQKGLDDHYQSKFCYQQCINFFMKQDEDASGPKKQQKINDILSHFQYIERMRLA